MLPLCHHSNPLFCTSSTLRPNRACEAEDTPLLTRSIVDQVQQFHDILAPKPAGAEWNSSNSLFAIWIGINDVVHASTTPPLSYQSKLYILCMCRAIPLHGYACVSGVIRNTTFT